MPFVQGQCPNCAGMLAVDNSNRAAICQFCGTAFVVEDAVNNYITNNVTNHNYGQGAVVNVYENHAKDFVIEAGVLKAYKGESPDVVIPDNVLIIGAYCFRNSNIRSVSIPNSVTEIGYGAFEECQKLTNVSISNGVKTICTDAFSGCTSLTSVTLPDGVTEIGYGAFCNCTSLTNVTIPNSVINIREPKSGGVSQYGAFGGCTSLTSITIPDSVTSINRAFSGCTSLTSITIPDSVTSIEGAFSGCTSLTSIVIPDSVTSIEGAFSGCTSLTSITIPNSVTEIGYDAFCNCTSLTSVTIPNSVTSIGKYAFYGCENLTEIIIPNGVSIIEENAFAFCKSLTSIFIPRSVTVVAEYICVYEYETYSAFRECSNLTSVVFEDKSKELEFLNAFKDTPYWRNYKHKLEEETRASRRAAGLCQHCGGKFKGCFVRTCVDCEKRKDY